MNMAKIKHVQLPQEAAEELLPAVPKKKAPAERRERERPPRYAEMAWRPMPYMDDYLKELRYRECKHGYIRVVRVGLSRFAAYMAEHHPDIRHPELITRVHIMDYKLWLEEEARDEFGKPLALSYRRKIMCYLRSWCKWMEQERLIQVQPYRDVPSPRTPKKPKPLEDEQITLLFEAHKRLAFVMSAFTWHRQEVILLLLFGWGLRIHELVALNVDQMDPRREVVLGINKGSEVTKPLPYDDEMKASVARYMGWRAKEAAKGETALLVEATHGTRLSQQRVYSIIVELGKFAGMVINPHRLRDSFGTTMVNSGAERGDVQKIFGHSNLDMTNAYVKVANKRVVAAHREHMGPILKRLMSENPGLPAGIDEAPPGWPQLEGPKDEEAS
jgi:integrase/recombinase XerD